MDLTSDLACKAVDIVRLLRDAGHQAYFAGGCVRDFLLQRTAQDIDIATSATPEEICRLFPKVIPIGLKYGVVSAIYGSHAFEITTFRQDLGYEDGRHPIGVAFGDARQDALRRDFTINGMFYDPMSGIVVDYVSGQDDLKNQIVRTIGQPHLRFEEDKLRMMRAVRFACNLDFQIESATLHSMKRMAHRILDVSWERIRYELLKMLTGPLPARALEELDASHLLDFILPEVAAMHGIAQPEQFHPEGDVFVHTRLMLQHMKTPSPTLALGVLLHDVGKPLTFEFQDRIRFDLHVDAGCTVAADMAQRLRLSNEDTEQIVELVRHHLRFMHVQKMRESTLKRFLRMAHFDEHLELHRLDCLASHGDLSEWEFCCAKLEKLSTEQVKPPRLIRGDDLIAIGLKPGPLFGKILRSVEDAQLEGTINHREEAMEFVIKHFVHGFSNE